MISSSPPRPDVAAGFALAGLAAIIALLAGCTVVDDVVYGRAQTAYSDAAAFARDNPETASWLPGDARDIRLVSSTRASEPQTLVFDSVGGVPDTCVEAPRISAPELPAGDLDVYDIDVVAVCDDWAVASDGDAFVAWTPAREAG